MHACMPRGCHLACLAILAPWLLAGSHAAATTQTAAVAPAQVLATALASPEGVLYVDTVIVLNATGAVGTLRNGVSATLAGSLGANSALDFGEATSPLFSIGEGGSLTLQSLQLLNLFTLAGQPMFSPFAALTALPAFSVAPGGSLTLLDLWVTMSCDDLTIWMSKACGIYSLGMAVQVLEDRLYVSRWVGSNVTYENVTFACAASAAPLPACLTAAVGDASSLYAVMKASATQGPASLYAFITGNITITEDAWPDSVQVRIAIYVMGPGAADAGGSTTKFVVDFGATRRSLVWYSTRRPLQLRNLALVNLPYPSVRRDWGSLFSIFVDPLRSPKDGILFGGSGSQLQLVDSDIFTPWDEWQWWANTNNTGQDDWIMEFYSFFLYIYSVNQTAWAPGTMVIQQLRQADLSVQFTNVRLLSYTPTLSAVGTFPLYPFAWLPQFDLSAVQMSSIARVAYGDDFSLEFDMNFAFDIWGALAVAADGNNTNLLLIEDVAVNASLSTYAGTVQVDSSVIEPGGTTSIIIAGDVNALMATRLMLDLRGLSKVLEIPYFSGRRRSSIRLSDLVLTNPAPGGMLPDGTTAPTGAFDWVGGDAAFANLSTPLWWIGCSLRDYPISEYAYDNAPTPALTMTPGSTGCISLQRVTIVVPQMEIEIMLFFAGLLSPAVTPAGALTSASSNVAAGPLRQRSGMARRLAQSPSTPETMSLVLPGKAIEALRNLSSMWKVSDYSDSHVTFAEFYHYGISGVNVTLTSQAPEGVNRSSALIPELYDVTYDPTPYSPPPPSPPLPLPPPSPSQPPLLPPPQATPSPRSLGHVGGGSSGVPLGGMPPVPPSPPAPPGIHGPSDGNGSGDSNDGWIGAAIGVPIGVAAVAGLAAALLVVRRRRRQTPPLHDNNGRGYDKDKGGSHSNSDSLNRSAKDSACTPWRRLHLSRPEHAAPVGGTTAGGSSQTRTVAGGLQSAPQQSSARDEAATSTPSSGLDMQRVQACSAAQDGGGSGVPKYTTDGDSSWGTIGLLPAVQPCSVAELVLHIGDTTEQGDAAKLRPDASVAGQKARNSQPRVTADSTHPPSDLLGDLATAVETVQQEVNDEQLTITDVLGQGSYGVVYRGTWRGLPVAVKTILFQDQLVGLETRRRQSVILEAAISANLHHPNVVSTYAYDMKPLNAAQPLSGAPAVTNLLQHLNTHDPGAIATDYKVFIIQEYCDGGALRQMVSQGAFRPPHEGAVAPARQATVGADGTAVVGVTPDEAAAAEQEEAAARDAAVAAHMAKVVAVALDVARGMAHIHSKNIIHGDLSSGNILLKATPQQSGARSVNLTSAAHTSLSDSATDSSSCHQSVTMASPFNFTSKVADFGLSVRMNSGVTHVSNHKQGTPMYMAPKVVSEGRLTKAADVYSYGVLLWELYSGQTVHQGVQAFVARYPKLEVLLMAGSVAPSEVLSFAPVLAAYADPCIHAYTHLASRCLSHDVRLRPTFEQVVEVLQRVRLMVMAGPQQAQQQHVAAPLAGDLATSTEEGSRASTAAEATPPASA